LFDRESEQLKHALGQAPAEQRTALVGALAENFTPGQTAALADQIAKQGAGDLSQAIGLSADSPETAKRILEGMELKTNQDFLPAGEDGAEMDRHIAAALGGADPESYSAQEDAIKSIYAYAASESRDTTGRLNAMRLTSSIAMVTGGQAAQNGEEPQTADESGDPGSEDSNSGDNAAPVLTEHSDANKPEPRASNDGVNTAGSNSGLEGASPEDFPNSSTAVDTQAEQEGNAKGVLTPNGKYAPFVNDNPEIEHPTDAIKSAQCPGNPRCRPPGDWEKYNRSLPRPKVTERTNMPGGIVFPNGWFIPPLWKDKHTLGPIGEYIHAVPELRVPFARFLFDRYYLGIGKEVKLTPEQFKEITDYVAKNPQTEVNKPDESKGQNYVKVEVGDKVLTRKAYNLDGHPGYGKSLGNVTVFYDEQGKPVGLYDNYNFNLSGHRSVPTNSKIAAVQAACATDPNANCKPFDITYGDYAKPPGTYTRNGIVFGEDGKPVNEFMKEKERRIQEEMKRSGRDPNVPIISGEY
jgi:hypothetical protein